MNYVPGQSKSAGRLRRRSRGVKEFSRVLITCEGEKTEPNYLREMCKALGLTAAVVEVIGKECGSSPISVCNYAAARLKEDSAFDEVFCVFDRDTHATFEAAVNMIASHASKKMRSIVSYPCFEYWILLHFRYTRGSVPAIGKKSSGDRMLSLVLDEWPAYAKGAKGVYSHMAAKKLTDVAIAHAVRARADVAGNGNPDPSTEVDKLVVRLRELGQEYVSLAQKM